MITIFKSKKDIPQSMEYIELNDLFFNQNTAILIDEKEQQINDVILDIDKLSTGCKTVLNVLYHPDKVFCLKECGNNALEILYNLEKGYVYSDYALIPFNINSVFVEEKNSKKQINDYESLKEWWENEE